MSLLFYINAFGTFFRVVFFRVHLVKIREYVFLFIERIYSRSVDTTSKYVAPKYALKKNVYSLPKSAAVLVANDN